MIIKGSSSKKELPKDCIAKKIQGKNAGWIKNATWNSLAFLLGYLFTFIILGVFFELTIPLRAELKETK